MKLQKFYTLTVAALLIGTVTAQAQTSNFATTAGPFDNLSHDCLVKEARGNQVLLLNEGDIVTQSFTACENGMVEKVYVSIKQSSNLGKISAVIQDSRGQEIAGVKNKVTAGFDGVLDIKLPAVVKAGSVYSLKLRALGTNIVLEGQYGQASENDLHLNGWKLDGNITTAGSSHERSDWQHVAKRRHPDRAGARARVHTRKHKHTHTHTHTHTHIHTYTHTHLANIQH